MRGYHWGGQQTVRHYHADNRKQSKTKTAKRNNSKPNKTNEKNNPTTVPLHRLEAWKAACVNSSIHRHGAACGKGFVSELSCRNHACRTTAEQRQLTLLASCRFQHNPSGNYLPQTLKKTSFGSKLEDKVWSQKWSHFWLRLMKQ